MMDYTLKNGSLDTLALRALNAKFYLHDNKADKFRELSDELQDLYEQIAKKRQELALLESQSAPLLFSENNLNDFFERHPAMSLVCGTDLVLQSSNQCVSFHTQRNVNQHSQNDDIIYVTLPLYSFQMSFQQDGHIRIQRNALEDLEVLFDDSPLTTDVNAQKYGHPHATLSSDDKTFDSVCQGNNRYIADYQDLLRNGHYDAADLLILLHRAAVWLETANISDMYGTYLSPKFKLIDEFYHIANIAVIDHLFDLCQQYTDGTASADVALQKIRTFLVSGNEQTSCVVKLLCPLVIALSYVGRPFMDLLFRLVWAMWLVAHYSSLNSDSRGEETLLMACKADFVTALSMDRLGLSNLFFDADFERTKFQALQAPTELRSYFESLHNSCACLAQIRPFAINL